ncbi:MAG: hypothetical protein O3A36_00565 [bacterium]|nr:hypothetical protein [bacterium]
MTDIEIVPAILRNTFEKITEDWNTVVPVAKHIQVDVTDGIFAGEKGFLDITRFAELPESSFNDFSTAKLELHMMVQTPGDFVDDIIELNPARCVFHIEAFQGKLDLPFVYNTIGEYTSTELGLAINPNTPIERLDEYLPIIQYILFMGYEPGIANQPINPSVFEKISTFHKNHPTIKISVDGHVTAETIPKYVTSGASILNANTSIFGIGNPQENMKQLELIAQMAGLP